MSEPDAGHVAAVATVHEAWCLGWGEGGVAGAVEPRPHHPAPEVPGGLTLARAHGYWKRCTLQKSSATATTRSLWERHRELMSVPSEPSGHTPNTAAALSLAFSLPPPTAQSFTASGTPQPWPPTSHVPGSSSQGRPGQRDFLGWICWFLDTHPSTQPNIPSPGQAPPCPPTPPEGFPQSCTPAHRRHGNPAHRCRWPTPGLGSHSDSSAVCSLQQRALGRGSPPSSALTQP